MYVVDETTNRYTTVAGNSLDYDAAGDQDGYDYQYDYENRLVKVSLDGNYIAEFSCDALGRRVEKLTNWGQRNRGRIEGSGSGA